MDEELKGAAYHEAGHAVTSHVLHGPTIIQVTIGSTEESDGGVQYEPVPDWFPPVGELNVEEAVFIRTLIVSYFAGSFAQEPIDGPVEARHSSLGDLFKVRELAACMSDSDGGQLAYMKDCEQEADRLVKIHWPVIEALAGALLAKETLTGDEAREIIETARSS
jgi:hypothetical protein